MISSINSIDVDTGENSELTRKCSFVEFHADATAEVSTIGSGELARLPGDGGEVAALESMVLPHKNDVVSEARYRTHDIDYVSDDNAPAIFEETISGGFVKIDDISYVMGSPTNCDDKIRIIDPYGIMGDY